MTRIAVCSVLALCLTVLCPGVGRGQFEDFGPLRPPGGRRSLPIYQGSWLPAQPVTGQPTTLEVQRHEFNVGAPLWRDDDTLWAASLRSRAEFFQTAAILPDSGRPFPQELYNLQLGTAVRHKLENGWTAGGILTIGSASDRPFHSIREMLLNTVGYVQVPVEKDDAWLFSVTYSPTREIAWPIPGVAYLYRPSEDFQAMIGVPTQIIWRPTDDLTFDLFYMVVRTVRTRLTCHLSPALDGYLGFAWTNDIYLLADREQTQYRFFSYEKKLFTGLMLHPGKNVSLDLSAGYAFDRFYFQGRRYADQNNDRVSVESGPFVALRGVVHF